MGIFRRTWQRTGERGYGSGRFFFFPLAGFKVGRVDIADILFGFFRTEFYSEDEEPDDESKWHPDEWGYSDGHGSELVKLSKSLWENHATLPQSRAS